MNGDHQERARRILGIAPPLGWLHWGDGKQPAPDVGPWEGEVRMGGGL
jgi:hypothetical protein